MLNKSLTIKKQSLQYEKTGVPYEIMDPLKILAQVEGKKTSRNLKSSHIKEISQSRGESAYVVDLGNMYLATVQESLGTKGLVADEMREVIGKTYYDALAQDTVAMMVNDLVVVGAKPAVVMAYWGAGGGAWFEDKERMKDLVMGWAKACDLAGASWGGGETPSLTNVVVANKVDLAGCCVGFIKPKSRLSLGDKLKEGDVIILFESSGIHANGISMARKIVENLPKRYRTKMSDGKMYGEGILKPTIIYAKIIQDIFSAGVDIHYMVNITGHGWRKIMRHKKSFTYRITKIPPVHPVFTFMMKEGPIEEKEAYGSLNMGAGLAIFVSKSQVQKVLAIAKKNNIKAYDAGVVERGKKQVIIEPKKIIFEGTALKVRA